MTAAKNAIVSWLLNFTIIVKFKSQLTIAFYSHVCEKRSKTSLSAKTEKMSFICMRIKNHFLSMADCKTVRISAYSSKRAQSNKRSATRVKTESETGEPVGRMRLARFARLRLLRHALQISLLTLRKKPECFAVYVNRAVWTKKNNTRLI